MVSLLLAFCLAATPGAPAGLAGEWAVDLSASSSADLLLKEWGASWVERQAASSLPVQNRIQLPDGRFDLTIDSAVLTRSESFPTDGSWVAGTARDGAPTRTRCFYEGAALVTVTEVTREGRTWTLEARRTLEDEGRTMRQHLTLRTPDGRSISADRVFRRAP